MLSKGSNKIILLIIMSWQNQLQPSHSLTHITEESQLESCPSKSLLETYHVSGSESSNSTSIIKTLSMEIEYLRSQLFKKEQQRSKEIQEIKRTMERLEGQLGKEVENSSKANQEVQVLRVENSKLRKEIQRLQSQVQPKIQPDQPKRQDIQLGKRQIAQLSNQNKKPLSKYLYKPLQSQLPSRQQFTIQLVELHESPTRQGRMSQIKQRLDRLDREISQGKEMLNRRKLSKCLTQFD